ncbi:hypothetical protein E1A91_A05G413700v1 [Gossypium mustelinum]|uniref:Uncharacterized protein n=1 Tax=Gossypium mustelinum TaxID=34275 RepID=A0A5D2ZJ21_GOSMU|nr:hypothetical protein E1A91_A05G413700v1 [Gossypium mustelinum]TYJ38008.1 hypothetical protein E1A91_A05G413700v1 [Gossypium mustelinum]TYJ38010.1 hypothetical protein E1A91_A05G413700v1 [Gossypium mustelinum]
MQISKEKKTEQKSKEKMLPLPLKLVRQAITHHPLLLSQNTHHRRRRSRRRDHHRRDLDEEEDDDSENDACNSKPSSYNFYHHSSKPTKPKSKTPFLLFLPTRELIGDTYRLANIAREMGMDLYPTPSLSHIIFSFSSSSPSPSSSSSISSASSSSASSSALSLSSSFSMPLPTGAVLISFPSLSSSSLSHLRSFVSLSKGLFKLVFITTDSDYDPKSDDARNWDCCSISLFSRRTGDRIESMQSFSRALTGMGWTLYSTRKNPSLDSLNTATKSVHLFRKVDSGRVRGGRGNGEHRTRELRLPSLDFRNAPLKILQYIVLMTDDVFYLG